MGSCRLNENFEHLFDESARTGRLGPTRPLGRGRNGRKRHSGNVLSWLICATSLSPLPLTHKSTRWSGVHLPFCPSIHATAWAVSNAGMIPSRRLKSANPESASLSVTATYVARPESLRYACSGPTPG